jgi:hypothetical protein
MTYVFIIGTVFVVLSLAASGVYWSVYAGTGEQVARLRAVGFFRWAMVVVLATFNIWIFTRVGGALKDIWFPAQPPPPPALIDGQLPGRPPPEELRQP